MSKQKDDSSLVEDLEQRIDTMQAMGDAELGSFTRADWIVLIVISIVIPVIVAVIAR